MASHHRFAIIASRYNTEIVDRLVIGAQSALEKSGVKVSDVPVYYVPGAFEIPLAAQRAAHSGQFHALIAIGCVIKGETAHFEYISNWVSQGIGRVALDTGVPVAFGILTSYTEEQAAARSQANDENKGFEAGMSAVAMADFTI